ncbi:MULTISPECIES: bifunctional sugar phosphate isomerase/epimerase/4-hydroxyphenylpyruvate dioxygenase family protein [unclassified Streptomyces]|uniref:bifunctional sugar phosphate isomerase/epimerase/4-hydroxyphenylpyruvate dioxygenase family protein n=1 Tax=unclassified Streptomyces TaxID=2593676 RepID=UPI002DDC8463|nr:TIM barrel protein [Streptomyces sp. NBC_01751]WSD28495.1 sugar phosphate isomerase/epimerase and 4-hydroxyphenylpyruvate domain-containing protein [Streptomyces sp. NBC_01751]WSF83033.1 sugar phosphate isomerase/epimerase and 4-hydroxyphenylpyruvate domain-containing protein [Streptomyces sp. NBC_01744]
MRTSIATVSISGTLTEKLNAAARAGFDGVEIFENDLLASPLTPEQIKDRAADLGLAISLYQPMRDIEGLPADAFAQSLRRAEHKFRVMRRLGADTVLVCSNVSPQAVDDDALAADQLRQLADLASEYEIRVAYEALAWGRHVNTYDHAWRIVESADHPSLGVCLDSFHILARGSDPKGIESIPGEKIFFLQLADAPLMTMDVLQWSRHYRCFPGQGEFDLAAFVQSTVRAGYQGPLSLEVFNDIFRQADSGRTAADAMRSLVALQEAAGITDPPAPVAPTAVAFAELVTPDTERVSTMLSALGFTRAGKHTSKPVDLWEQGGARILVNTAPASGRGSLSLAAVGLESPDPPAASKRAESMGAPVLPRRSTGRDIPIDAVAAPDGTELFFCATDRPNLPNWLNDFQQVPHRSGGGCVVGVDHVALTQPWHQYDEAILFYRSVIGLQPHDSVDVPDPYGLRRSRAVSTVDGGVRIALSIAPAPTDSATASQHIAFATDDIISASRRLRDTGHLLPVPDNYYDDLAARFEFGPGELETYRELGILYDRDENGQFRHCYTSTIGNVFFELVQRDEGYRGFGEQSAHIRLTAQLAR